MFGDPWRPGTPSFSDPARTLPAWVFLCFCLQKAVGPGDSSDRGRVGTSLSRHRHQRTGAVHLLPEMPGSPEGKPRRLKQSQRHREARAQPQPSSPGRVRIRAHACACVTGTNHAALARMLGSPGEGVSRRDHMHFPRQGGAERICFRLADGTPPAGPRGRPHRNTQRPHTCRGCRGLSPGAHLPERQEPLPEPPPDIRWAENAKNQDFETLLPRLAPQWEAQQAPMHPRPTGALQWPQAGPSLGMPSETLSLTEEGMGKQRKRGAREERRKPKLERALTKR